MESIFEDYKEEMKKVAQVQTEYQAILKSAENSVKDAINSLRDLGINDVVWGTVTFGWSDEIYKIGWAGDKGLLVYVVRFEGADWGIQTSIKADMALHKAEFVIAVAAVLPNLLSNIVLAIEAKIEKIKQATSKLHSKREEAAKHYSLPLGPIDPGFYVSLKDVRTRPDGQ